MTRVRLCQCVMARNLFSVKGVFSSRELSSVFIVAYAVHFRPHNEVVFFTGDTHRNSVVYHVATSRVQQTNNMKKFSVNYD